MAEYPTAEQSAMFIQLNYGEKPQFRGLHAITGDMTKNDGARTPVYAYLAGAPVVVATQKATPEPVTLNIDGYLQAIGDLVSRKRDCPIDVILLADKCLRPDQKRSWGRWGATDPEIYILLPNAFIEQRTLSNVLSREGNQPAVMGGVQLKFDDWKLIKGNQSVALTTAVAGTTVVGVASTHCDGCLDAECGGVGGCSVWYLAAANGDVMHSDNSGVTWEDVSPTTPWTANTAIYADELIVLAGGHDGVAGDYGVKRSADGGATWTEVLFDTAAAGKTGLVKQILNYQDSLFAFTALGIWMSTNDGVSWTQVDATEGFLRCAMDESGFGVAVTATTLYYTTDGGLRWGAVADKPSEALSGTGLNGVAISGGYVHVVDGTEGYQRATVSSVKNGVAAWTVMDTTTLITDIMFCSRLMGFRLRGTAMDMTLNGGYSWKSVSVSGTAPTFTQMFSCAGRLAIAGGVYFGYFNPFYDTSSYTGSGSECGC